MRIFAAGLITINTRNEEISSLHAARLHLVWPGDNDDTVVVETIQRRERSTERRHTTTVDGRRSGDHARLLVGRGHGDLCV